MFTLAVPVSLLKPTEISEGRRPRQSKFMVWSVVMKVTLFSSGKIWVETRPLPSKSIVTL